MPEYQLRIHVPADADEPIPSGPLAISQVCALYQLHGIKGGSAAALTESERILSDLCEFLGGKMVDDARPIELVTWLNAHPTWRSDWTIRRVIATVQTAFNWAARYGLIIKNPFAGITHPAGETGRAMRDDEFQALMRSSRAPFRRVLCFLRMTGCRPGEMSALEWSFFDEMRGCFSLTKHKTAKKTRERKPRVIVLPEPAMAMIRWIRRNSPHERFVFVHSRGQPWTRYALCTNLKRLRKRLGLENSMKLYGLRHAAATRAILAGVDIKTLATILGHASTRITESTYVHIDGEVEHLREALERAAKASIRKSTGLTS